MIHEIGVLLQAKLREKGFKSALVVDGPEPTGTAAWGRERVVIERTGGDRPSDVRSQRRNPQHTTVRSIGAKITVYAQSTKSGALPWEHERRADTIVDLVLTSLEEIASGVAPPYRVWAWTGGEFVTPPDLEGTERKGGAAYELTATFDRAVWVKSFVGDIADEMPVDGGVDGVGVVTERRVGINGSDSYETV